MHGPISYLVDSQAGQSDKTLPTLIASEAHLLATCLLPTHTNTTLAHLIIQYCYKDIAIIKLLRKGNHREFAMQTSNKYILYLHKGVHYSEAG